MGAFQILAAFAALLLAVVAASLWARWQVNRVIADRRAEREKAELAITNLTAQVDDLSRKLDDLTRTVDHLCETRRSSSDSSIAVSSGLLEALDRIESLSERVSKVADISFRELARLGERVSDLSQRANHNRPTPGNDETAQ
jgi:methyl-accepting chemotaxis protein